MAGDAVDPHVASQERGPRAQGPSSLSSDRLALTQLREGLKKLMDEEWQRGAIGDLGRCRDQVAALLVSEGTEK